MAMNQQAQPNAVATISSAELAIGTTFNERQVELIRQHIAPEATEDELMLFVQVASSRGLDPFRKHIYAVTRYDSKKKQNVTAHQVSIDGLRLIAERSGRYEGQTLPQWCGPDGVWKEVWLPEDPPAAAKVGVYIKGAREPLYAIALYRTFVQKYKDNSGKEVVAKFWKDMPEHMLAKVAESQALRKAFPEEAGGLYTKEEMAQADNPERGGYIDHGTGEIVEAGVQAMAAPSDPERQRKARMLWEMVHLQWGWDKETLQAAAVTLEGLALEEMNAEQLSDLRIRLAAMPTAERQAIGGVMATPDEPAAEAS